MGYGYFRFAGSAYALGAIGLISFTAVAQFAPALIGGIFWNGGTRRGAITGLVAGIAAWTYTLLLPSFARSGWLDPSFLSNGPGGVALLRPYALFGLEGLDPLSHALFWSMALNVGLYVAVSLLTGPIGERVQANAFVDVFRRQSGPRPHPLLARQHESRFDALVGRFSDQQRADGLRGAGARRQCRSAARPQAERRACAFRRAADGGAIGAASARVVVASAVKGGEVTMRNSAHAGRNQSGAGIQPPARAEIGGA